MFPSYEEVGELLDELAQELPRVFFQRLNLGIVLDEAMKLHPEAQGEDLVILGEYSRSNLGAMIKIYYGSFRRIYSQASKEDILMALRETLRHEFTHHIQYLAGNADLEKEDQEKLKAWRKRKKGGKN